MIAIVICQNVSPMREHVLFTEICPLSSKQQVLKAHTWKERKQDAKTLTAVIPRWW